MEQGKINLVLITKDKILYEIFEVRDTKKHLLWPKTQSEFIYETYFIHSDWEKSPKEKAIDIIMNLITAYRNKTKSDFKVTII